MNEKWRGVSAPIWKPVAGLRKLVWNDTSSQSSVAPGGWTSASACAPRIRSAVSTESASRDAIPGRITSRSTTTSTRRGRSGHRSPASSRSRISPSARTRTKPCRRRSPSSRSGSAQSGGSSGASSTTFVPSCRPPSAATMSADVMRSSRSPVAGSCGVPAAAHSTRRWSWISVAVATVERGFRDPGRWSIAIAGLSPSIESTSGRSNWSMNCRA